MDFNLSDAAAEDGWMHFWTVEGFVGVEDGMDARGKPMSKLDGDVGLTWVKIPKSKLDQLNGITDEQYQEVKGTVKKGAAEALDEALLIAGGDQAQSKQLEERWWALW